MKSYRINRLRSSCGQSTPGFESLECFDDGSHVAELLVPTDVAQQLVLDTKQAVSVVAPAPAAQDMSSPAPSVARRSELHVSMPSESFWHEPPKPGMLAVWDWRMLSRLVEHHNAGSGSADLHDRRRIATVLQGMVTEGPWRFVTRPPSEDRDCLLRELRCELGHMPGLVENIEASIASAAASGLPVRLGPLLLVGQPGTGKTYAALRVAELLGLRSRLIDMAAQQTNSFLHGSDKHWGNASPGALFELLILGTHANPLIVLDEIDKAPRRSNYDPLPPLHSALESATAKATKDLCIQATFDASHVSYVATANSLRGIPLSLLSRFEIIHCVEPGPRESLRMARLVWAQVAAKFGVEGRPPRAALVELAEFPPRRMVQILERAISKMRVAGRNHVALCDFEPTRAAAALH